MKVKARAAPFVGGYSTCVCLESVPLLQRPGTEAANFHQSKEPSEGAKGRVRGLTFWGLRMRERVMNRLDPTRVFTKPRYDPGMQETRPLREGNRFSRTVLED